MWIVITIAIVSFVIAIRLNIIIKKKVSNQRFRLFDDRRRNFDCLVIGIPNKEIILNKEGTYYALWQNRSLYASYVILRALFSLLKEDGNGVVKIYTNRKCDGMGYFDYAILHSRTIEEERCSPNVFIRRLPLLFYITQRFQSFICQKQISNDRYDLLCKNITEFCKNRNIKVNIIEI